MQAPSRKSRRRGGNVDADRSEADASRQLGGVPAGGLYRHRDRGLIRMPEPPGCETRYARPAMIASNERSASSACNATGER